MDGFVAGHAISYRLWKASASREIGAVTPTYNPVAPIPTFSSLGTAVVSLVGLSAQNVVLNQGWNIMSFYLSPSNIDMKAVVQPLIDATTLVKVQDEGGRAIENLPAPIGWINAIGSWGATEGYNIKVSALTTLSVTGTIVSLPFSIPLSSGWNIMSYPVQTARNGLTTVQPLITAGSLVKVQDEAGRAIENLPAPIGWINMIGDFQPGEGYYIKVNTATTLTIGASAVAAKMDVASIQSGPAQHFKTVQGGNPYEPMNVYVDLGGSALTGQIREVGLFDGDRCVGASGVAREAGKVVVGVVVRGDEALTEEVEGATANHTLTVRFWDGMRELTLPLERLQEVGGPRELVFTPRESAVLRVNSPEGIDVAGLTTMQLFQCYPNPFNPSTTISFYVPSTGDVRLVVYNVLGEEVRQLVTGSLEAGLHTVVWDAKNTKGIPLPSGLYLARLAANDKVTTMRMLLTR